MNDSGGVIAPVKVHNDANVAGYLNGPQCADEHRERGYHGGPDLRPQLIGVEDGCFGRLADTHKTTDHATKGTIHDWYVEVR